MREIPKKNAVINVHTLPNHHFLELVRQGLEKGACILSIGKGEGASDAPGRQFILNSPKDAKRVLKYRKRYPFGLFQALGAGLILVWGISDEEFRAAGFCVGLEVNEKDKTPIHA